MKHFSPPSSSLRNPNTQPSSNLCSPLVSLLRRLEWRRLTDRSFVDKSPASQTTHPSPSSTSCSLSLKNRTPAGGIGRAGDAVKIRG
ncbi:hypothetical protein Hanom_Chr11g00990381 [Helianthus anomalus]